jgi:hypothetical protein
MKPPETVAQFSPVAMLPGAAAEALLGLALDEMHGSLGHYFVDLAYDPAARSYEPAEEFMDLEGRDDLLRRVDKQKNCMWRFHIGMGFATTFVYPAVFVDPGGGPGLSLMLDFDPSVTGFLLSAEETRAPFGVVLARFAAAIGAGWFLSGMFNDTWAPLPEAVPPRDGLNPMPYIVGWKASAFPDEAVAGGLGVEVGAVKRTTLGYHFLLFY